MTSDKDPCCPDESFSCYCEEWSYNDALLRGTPYKCSSMLDKKWNMYECMDKKASEDENASGKPSDPGALDDILRRLAQLENNTGMTVTVPGGATALTTYAFRADATNIGDTDNSGRDYPGMLLVPVRGKVTAFIFRTYRQGDSFNIQVESDQGYSRIFGGVSHTQYHPVEIPCSPGNCFTFAPDRHGMRSVMEQEAEAAMRKMNTYEQAEFFAKHEMYNQLGVGPRLAPNLTLLSPDSRMMLAQAEYKQALSEKEFDEGRSSLGDFRPIFVVTMVITGEERVENLSTPTTGPRP